MNMKKILGRLTLAAVAASVLYAVDARAASECAGLEQTACLQNARCNWWSGRKDGKPSKRSPHCRIKSKKELQKQNLPLEPSSQSSTGAEPTSSVVPQSETAPAGK